MVGPRVWLALVLVFVAAAPSQAQEYRDLFNGKDFEGWEGHKHLWSIKGDVIIARNTEPIKVSTYLLTKRKFSDFRLTGTVKLVQSEMHSGIAFWGRKAPDKGDEFTYAGHLVMFPDPWGMFDLFGRSNLSKLGVDPKPGKKAGKQKDWHARITEQVPDKVLAWVSEGGATNNGTVIFKPGEDGNMTNIQLHLEFVPEDFQEQVGGALGFVSRQVEGDSIARQFPLVVGHA